MKKILFGFKSLLSVSITIVPICALVSCNGDKTNIHKAKDETHIINITSMQNSKKDIEVTRELNVEENAHFFKGIYLQDLRKKIWSNIYANFLKKLEKTSITTMIEDKKLTFKDGFFTNKQGRKLRAIQTTESNWKALNIEKSNMLSIGWDLLYKAKDIYEQKSGSYKNIKIDLTNGYFYYEKNKDNHISLKKTSDNTWADDERRYLVIKDKDEQYWLTNEDSVTDVTVKKLTQKPKMPQDFRNLFNKLDQELILDSYKFKLKDLITPPKVELKYKIVLNDQNKMTPFYFVELQSVKVANMDKLQQRCKIDLKDLKVERFMNQAQMKAKRTKTLAAIEKLMISNFGYTAIKYFAIKQTILSAMEEYQNECIKKWNKDSSIFLKKDIYALVKKAIKTFKNKVKTFIDGGEDKVRAWIESLSTKGTQVKFKKTNYQYFNQNDYELQMHHLEENARKFYES